MKKITALIAAMAVVLTLAACKPGATEQSATPAPTQTSEQEKTVAMKPGDSYTIFFCETTTENLWVDGITGSRAKERRERWQKFQEKYGVKITWLANTFGDGWLKQVPAAAAAGEPLCDIFDIGGPFAVPQAMTYGSSKPENYYVDLGLYSEYTNFDDPGYWDIEASKSVGYYGGKQYVAVPQEAGAGGVLLNQVCFFNKELIKRGGHSAEEIYALYDEGKWDFEHFRTMVIDCTDPDRGIYGMAASRNYMSVYSLICANGGSVLTNDQSGMPHFTADSKQALTAVNYFIGLCRDDKAVQCEGDFWQEEAPFFRRGQVAFMLTYANRACENENTGSAIYQDESLDYGIVLPPKGPDAQDYRSDRNWFTPYAVFKGHANIAGVVQMLSMYIAPEFAQDSYENYEIMKSQSIQFFRDERSLDILKDAAKKSVSTSYMAYWDIGGNGTGWLTTMPMAKWISGESTPEKDYAAAKDALDLAIAKLLGEK